MVFPSAATWLAVSTEPWLLGTKPWSGRKPRLTKTYMWQTRVNKTKSQVIDSHASMPEGKESRTEVMPRSEAPVLTIITIGIIRLCSLSMVAKVQLTCITLWIVLVRR